MAKPKIILWLLNRVVRWNRDLLAATLMSQFDVRIGRRVVRSSRSGEFSEFVELSVNALEDSAPGELMHEGAGLPLGDVTKYNEYFVPIPIKCVGSRITSFWNNLASQSGLLRLAELSEHMIARARS